MCINPTSNLFSVLRSYQQLPPRTQTHTECNYTGCKTVLNMLEVRTFSEKCYHYLFLAGFLNSAQMFTLQERRIPARSTYNS
jgi:hypothetical protein